MPDLLQTGSAWLAAQLKEHAAKTVTYARGAASVSLSATIGRTEFEQTDDQGGVTKFESRDFLIDAADLVLSGAVTVPARGDTIAETIGGTTRTYAVMDFGGGQPAWRYSDNYRAKLRVHTKQTS